MFLRAALLQRIVHDLHALLSSEGADRDDLSEKRECTSAYV
jgi:hypothetical protein